MADRYWVGGSGSWDATSTTNWSATSGGAGGASAPTSIDDVYFDVNSNTGTDAFTVTVTGTSASPANCRDFTASGLDGAMTLTQGATSVLDVYGSMTLPATNLTWTGTNGNQLRFRSTTTGKTVTTNGVSIGGGAISNVDFNGVGGGWTLGSALTTTGNFVVNAGTFNTGDFNVTAIQFNAQFSNAVRIINFGTSILTFSSNNALFLGGTNLTFNAGTSSIVCTANNATFGGFGQTFYNVSFTNTAVGTATINGANTFNDLTFTSLAATGVRQIALGANQTVSGTLTFGTGNTAIRRMFVRSAVAGIPGIVGTPRTITLNGTLATLADVDFRAVVSDGTAGTWTGTRLGDCGGNSNITFDAAKTVYRVGTGNWSATQWSLSSGGSVDVNNFPLAQDTALFDTGTVTGAHTFDQSWNVGNLDMSALNVAVTLNFNGAISFYGDVILNSNITPAGLVQSLFAGSNRTQKLTSAGKTFTNPWFVRGFNVTVELQDAFNSSNEFNLDSGIFSLNGFNATTTRFASVSGTATRSIAFGTNKFIITGNAATIIAHSDFTGFSYTGTPRFECNYSGSVGTRIIDIGRASGATESNVVDVYITAGTDIVDLRNIGAQHFRNLDFTGFAGSLTANQDVRVYGDLTYSTGMTLGTSNTALQLLKSSGIQTITTNGKTLDFPITKSAVGTVQLIDNLTMGSTRTLTHTAGTLDLNDQTLTTGLYSSTGTLTRQLDVGTGTLAVTGASFTASGSNYTTAGSGLVSMTSSSAKTFAGGGFTYPTLNQGGSGTLTITGANTFNNISNTLDGASTINFPANTITRVLNMKLRGGIGKLVSMRSSIDGTKYTIQT